MKNWFSQFFAQIPRQGQNAARLALAFIVAAFLATLVFTFVAVQFSSWQAYVVVAGFAVFFALQFFVIRAARQNQTDRAGILLVTAVCYIVLVMNTFMEGVGQGLSIALALVIVEIVFDTLSGPLATRVRASSLAFAVGMFFLDSFAWWARPSFPVVQYSIPFIAAATALSIGLLMIGRLGIWRDVSLARKLLLSFGIFVLLTLGLGIVSFTGLRNVESSYDRALANGQQMQVEALRVQDELKFTRELEQEFLLNWQEQGFVTARENYIVPLLKNIVTLREDLRELSRFSPIVGSELGPEVQAQFDADLIRMEVDLRLYEQNIYKTLQFVQLRGFEDTGFEGQFRVVVQALEAEVYEREGLDELVITTLQIRRHEKDYLLRGDQEYIDNVHQLIAELKQQIAISEGLEPTEKQELSALADQYIVAFDALVEKDVELATAIEDLKRVELAMVPLAANLTSIGQQLSEFDIETAQDTSARSNLGLAVAITLALILAIVFTATLSRQISQPVVSLTKAAQELQSGNYDVQIEVKSKDELGTLGATFNTMAARLKETFALVAQRATELQTVAEVSASTSTVLETEKLLWNVSNLTKERFGLYHAHIYLMNDENDTLVLAAGAGEAGQKMVAAGRSIPVEREHSLVARAARERRGVIVNDVQSDPDFLPNPLLPETRSELAVPMIVNDRVIGVFDIQSDQLNRFTQENADIQTTLATQISIAVQNARSYSEVQARAEREALIASINQKIESTSNVESALQVAIRELGRALSQETRVVLKTTDNSIQN